MSHLVCVNLGFLLRMASLSEWNPTIYKLNNGLHACKIHGEAPHSLQFHALSQQAVECHSQVQLRYQRLAVCDGNPRHPRDVIGIIPNSN